jgi:hypothetical protein
VVVILLRCVFFSQATIVCFARLSGAILNKDADHSTLGWSWAVIFLAYDAVRMRGFSNDCSSIRVVVPTWHSFEILNLILEAPEFWERANGTANQVSRETR